MMWLRVERFWIGLKVAVICWLVFIVSWQVGLPPLQPPPAQPAKDEFGPAVSVRVTAVPAVKLALQVGVQLIPEGVLEIVPAPVPARLTVSTAGFGIGLKLAVTCRFALSISVQVGLPPLQPPVHPAKSEFAAAVSVRVT